MATATSTLILSLQARNESQAAFAEIRAAMQEQVTQAREASAQQQTAVKASAEQQLLAVKQGLAQQVLAQRQALEQQVAAIRAGGTGNVDAQVLAARQGYEQQVLAARTAAEDKALAIKMGMAQELDAVRAGLAQQVDAQKIASAEQIAAVRAQATEEVAALRAEAVEGRGAAEGGMLGRVPLVGGLLGGERAAGLLDLGKTVVGFAAATAAITAVVEGIHELPRAFAEAATEGEQFQVQMTNFYGTMQAAGQVLEYTNEQATKMPFTLGQIRAATASLAESGIDPSKFLPAAGDIAAAYHTQLTDFTSVVNRAIATGSTRGLTSYLHMTKAQLAAAGVEWDGHGKLISASVEPALERIAHDRFGDAMARQGNTAQGAMIRLQNAWELFKETAGEGLFAGLKGTLAGIANWLDTHQAAVRGFAAAVGSALGTMLADGMRAAQWFIANFGPPIAFTINLIVGAWRAAQPAIAAAIAFINTVIAQIGTFLQTQVLPVVYQAIGQVTTWWNDHGAALGAILGVIFGTIGVFFGNLQANMQAALDVLHGIWLVGWNGLAGTLGLVLDLLTLNFGKFGQDLDRMAANIAAGFVLIFEGLLEKVTDIVYHLADPINAIEHALYGATVPFAEELFNLAAIVELTWHGMINKVISALNMLIKPLTDTHSLLYQIVLLNPATPELIKIAMRASGRPGGDVIAPFRVQTPAEMAKTRANWINSLALGFRPDVNLRFGQTEQQAIADERARGDQMVADLLAKANLFTGAPTHYATAAQDTAAGKTWLQHAKAWVLDLSKQGIKLPSLPDVTDLGKLPPLVAPPVPGAAPGPTAGKSPQEIALDLARSKFALDLASGHLTLAQGVRDVAAIIKAERALPPSQRPNVYQLALDALTYTKDVDTKLLDTARQHYDFDKGQAHPDVKKLLQDEASILKIIAAVPGEGGVTGYDYLLAKQQMDKEIADLRGKPSGVPRQPVAPVPRYGALAGETGYGQTTVSFGGAQANPWQSMVAALREQVAHLRAQLAKDDQLIALLEVGNATAGAELGELRSLHGTVRTPPPPQPAHSVNSHLKARGGHALVGRP